MTDTDCSNCPLCVVDRTEPILRAANVQVCGVRAMRRFLGDDRFTFGLRFDAPLSGEVRKALTDLVIAHIVDANRSLSVPMFKRGHSLTAEDERYVLTIEITSRWRDETHYKICYHVKTPPVAAG